MGKDSCTVDRKSRHKRPGTDASHFLCDKPGPRDVRERHGVYVQATLGLLGGKYTHAMPVDMHILNA